MFHVKQLHYEIAVVGGGHAGVEAAAAAARMGAHVALVTQSAEQIGVMSCNPAIGGLGKGHLVREIDALGGLMGLCADDGGIQFRLLNRRKGPAVQGPRAQMDRELYRQSVRERLRSIAGVHIIEGMAEDLLITNGQVSGVSLDSGVHVVAQKAILATGTFLRGRIHRGADTELAGRLGDSPSIGLADALVRLGLPMGRLKTGTPPRLCGKSVDWDALERQEGDAEPVFLSFATETVQANQVCCAITHTNERTHDVIRQNLAKSALYSGAISGQGPRYCPSIEDKVLRFGDKESHQVFLEPEGLDYDTVYPNGVSTSLPKEVQIEYIQTIAGLENAEIKQFGYAIEYDYVDPRSLDLTLQLSALPNLYLAGQINGTTGYEEAAAQGLMCGINAVLALRGEEPFIMSRSEGYIGVLIDDLTSRGVTEPYRMFTSRAEFRLHLRADNADQRLTPKAIELGLIGDDQQGRFARKQDRLGQARSLLTSHRVSSKQARDAGLPVSDDGAKRTLDELLRYPDILLKDLEKILPSLAGLDDETARQLEREAIYAAYYERQARDVETLRKDENLTIPANTDFAGMAGLSAELKGKLTEARPKTIAQAARIEGMTPAALLSVILDLKRREKRSA